jgi:hypothetical protein
MTRTTRMAIPGDQSHLPTPRIPLVTTRPSPDTRHKVHIALWRCLGMTTQDPGHLGVMKNKCLLTVLLLATMKNIRLLVALQPDDLFPKDADLIVALLLDGLHLETENAIVLQFVGPRTTGPNAAHQIAASMIHHDLVVLIHLPRHPSFNQLSQETPSLPLHRGTILSSEVHLQLHLACQPNGSRGTLGVVLFVTRARMSHLQVNLHPWLTESVNHIRPPETINARSLAVPVSSHYLHLLRVKLRTMDALRCLRQNLLSIPHNNQFPILQEDLTTGEV